MAWGKAETLALLASFGEFVKRVLPFVAAGAYWQNLRAELLQEQVNSAIDKANLDEVRENHAEYERLRNLPAGDNADWLSDCASQSGKLRL